MKTQTKYEASTLFIPAWLDEAGLTAAQFRLVCHIARCGRCRSSLRAISKTCRMKRETVQVALDDLLALGVVVKKPRSGKTSILSLSTLKSTRPRAVAAPIAQPQRQRQTLALEQYEALLKINPHIAADFYKKHAVEIVWQQRLRNILL